MVSSDTGDESVQAGGNTAMSRRSGQHKDETRKRLAQSLRANLHRRKAQQRQQMRQKAAHLSNAATAEARAPETIPSQALLPRE